MIIFQQIIVEEAILYIEELQKQLLNNWKNQEDLESWEKRKTNSENLWNMFLSVILGLFNML